MADNKKIGARLVIDGEQEFRSAITGSKTALKELDSELKLVSKQFKDNSTSMEALRAKQQVYIKQQEELADKSKLLADAIKKAQETQEKNKKIHEDTAKSIKDLQNALENAKNEYGENSDEVKKLEQELEKTTKEYDKQEATIGKLDTKMSKWNTELNETQTELLEVNNNLNDVTEKIRNYDENIDNASDSTEELGKNAKEAGENTAQFGVSLGTLVSAEVIAKVLIECARAIKEVATAAIDVGMQFQSSMSNVAALSGATGDELEQLSAKAKEMGASTMFSASQAADAFGYMALAGWDTTQMLDGIDAVLGLAAAANMDLAQASDIVTDSLTAFGLEAKDATKFSDEMAYAMANSNTNVEQLGEAYKNCAATAGSMGYSVEEVTAALSTMANAGVKGGEAGTALNAVMIRLATDTKNCATELEKYGVAVYDEQGNLNSLSSILEGTAQAFSGLTQEEQANLSKMIAGTSHYSAFQTIMNGVNASAEEGAMGFADYAEALANCDGAAQEMANTMQDNLKGDITILQSALEGLGIAAEEVFDESLREGVQGATDAVNVLADSVARGDMHTSLANLSESMGTLINHMSNMAVDVLPGLIDGLALFVGNLDKIVPLATGAAASLGVYKAAVALAEKETLKFNLALEANPVAFWASVIAGAVASIALLDASLSDVNPEMKRMSEEAESAANATREMNASVDEMVRHNESQKAVINGLVSELEQLQSKESLTNEERARSIDIVGQLNTAFPELNLAIDEQTGLLEDGQEAWTEYVESMLKEAEAVAVQQKLIEVESQRLENEYALNDLWNAMDSTMQTKIKREAELRNLQERGIQLTAEESEELSNLSMWMMTLSPQEVELYQNSLGLVQASEELDRQYEILTGKLGEVSTATEEAAEATVAYVTAKEEEIQISEELAKAIEDETASLKKNLDGQVTGFEKVPEAAKHSKAEVLEALKSQQEAMEDWSVKMAELASRGVDDGILRKLANMGYDGVGYVDAFLEMTAGELSEANRIWGDSLKLTDATANELVEEYMLGGNKAGKAYIDGEWKAIEEGEGDVVQKMIDDFVGSPEWNRMSPEVREKVLASMEAMRDVHSDAPEKTANEMVNSLINSPEWARLSPEIQQKILDSTKDLETVPKGDPQLNVGVPNAMVEALMNSPAWNNLTFEAKQKILDAGQAMAEGADGTGTEAGQELGENTAEGVAEGIEAGKDRISEAITNTFEVDEGTAEEIAETYSEMAETAVTSYSDALTESADSGAVEEAVTSMTDATVDTFNNNLEASEGGPSGATQRIGDSVATGYIDGQQAHVDDGSIALVAQTTVDTTLETARTGLEIAEDGAESMQFHRIGLGIDEGLIAGQEEKQEVVYTTAETMFTQIVDTANEILSYDVFYEIGQNIGLGLAEGMEAMVDTVSQAGTKLAKAAETATKSALQINSPSKVFKGLGNSVGEGFELGIENGFADVDKVMREVLPDPDDYTQSFDSVMNASTNRQMSGMADVINNILPQLNSKSGPTSVNVVLQGDAAGVFKLVKAENQKMITATGYHSLA